MPAATRRPPARQAESNFKMALKAVDNYLTNVSENRLLKEQDTLDIRTLRQDLLKSALPFYQEFVHQRSHDPQLREQLANAYFRLGDISRVIGSVPGRAEVLSFVARPLGAACRLRSREPRIPELGGGLLISPSASSSCRRISPNLWNGSIGH